MLLRLQTYNLLVPNWPSKALQPADALSQAFFKEQEEDQLHDYTSASHSGGGGRTAQVQESNSREGSWMQLLKDITLRGWPNERNVVQKDIQP